MSGRCGRRGLCGVFVILATVGFIPPAEAASISPADSTFAEIVRRARSADRMVITHIAGAYKRASGRLDERWVQAIVEALDLEHRSPSTHPCSRWTCSDSIVAPGQVQLAFGSGKLMVRFRWTFWTGQLDFIEPTLPACLDIRDRHFQLLRIVRQALPRDEDLRNVALCRAVDLSAIVLDSSTVNWERATFAEGDPRIESMPEAISKVPPAYPDIAREAGVAGIVMVRARVGTDGRVTETSVTSPNPMLDAAAVAAVKQWRFRPGRVAGRPANIWIQVPVRFSLH